MQNKRISLPNSPIWVNSLLTNWKKPFQNHNLLIRYQMSLPTLLNRMSFLQAPATLNINTMQIIIKNNSISQKAILLKILWIFLNNLKKIALLNHKQNAKFISLHSSNPLFLSKKQLFVKILALFKYLNNCLPMLVFVTFEEYFNTSFVNNVEERVFYVSVLFEDYFVFGYSDFLFFLFF